ncbi:hypothetical protein RRG08_060807 [Elysia crispata]|uniref:Uncharacterized protein n=1 Tax=Elysia crispata TaxID=231223 RepID=A0AAE0YW34_9GAST|nr:hypothetical protein RRG08_060807 [Elysia crispata]
MCIHCCACSPFSVAIDLPRISRPSVPRRLPIPGGSGDCCYRRSSPVEWSAHCLSCVHVTRLIVSSSGFCEPSRSLVLEDTRGRVLFTILPSLDLETSVSSSLAITVGTHSAFEKAAVSGSGVQYRAVAGLRLSCRLGTEFRTYFPQGYPCRSVASGIQ